MLIKIDKDIFEGENFRGLNTLIQILSWKGRYELFIDLPFVLDSDLFKRLDEDDRVNIEGQFNKCVTESKRPGFHVSESEDNAFNIEEAIRFFTQPVAIVLENSLNDGPFVRAIIEHFDKKGILSEHLKNSWIKFGNSGGKDNFVNYLSAELRTFRNLPKENHHYLRAFVITDSDKKFPDMEQENDKKRIIEFLEENNIPFHILEKREMENYLPDEAIDSIPDNREFIDAYLKLKPVQKDYFDLEKGFPNRNFEQLSNGIKDLFRGVNEEDKKVFRKRSLAEKYKSSGQTFKSEFPKLFHSAKVTKETLLKRCAHHSDKPEKHPYNPKELPGLVERIAKLL